MPNYTFRVHKFAKVDHGSTKEEWKNEYFVESVSAESTASAMGQVKTKHPEENTRIFLKKIS